MEEMLNYDFDFTVDGSMVRNYCTSCQDQNPIHFSPHNVVPGGLITGLLLSNPVDNYYIRKLETQFLNVTYYPATIKVKRKVTSYKIGRSGIRAKMEMVKAQRQAEAEEAIKDLKEKVQELPVDDDAGLPQ